MIIRFVAGRKGEPVGFLSHLKAESLGLRGDGRRWVVLVDRESPIVPSPGDMVHCEISGCPRPGVLFVKVLQVLWRNVTPPAPVLKDGMWVLDIPLGAVIPQGRGVVVPTPDAEDPIVYLQETLPSGLLELEVPELRVESGSWVIVFTEGQTVYPVVVGDLRVGRTVVPPASIPVPGGITSGHGIGWGLFPEGKGEMLVLLQQGKEVSLKAVVEVVE